MAQQLAPQSNSQHQKKPDQDSAMNTNISTKVNNVASTLRILEERYSNLRNKSQLSEQNLIDIEKDVTKDMKILSEEIMDLKHDIKDIHEKLTIITNEMQNLANKDEFKVLDKYLDMWQPLNFVTRKELERYLDSVRKKS